MAARRAMVVRVMILIAAACSLLAGCRGDRSTEPPVHLNLNMDHQKRFDAQEANATLRQEREQLVREIVGLEQERLRMLQRLSPIPLNGHSLKSEFGVTSGHAESHVVSQALTDE